MEPMGEFEEIDFLADSGMSSAGSFREMIDAPVEDAQRERIARMGLCAALDGGDPRMAALVREQGPVAVWEYLRNSGSTRATAVRVRGVDVEAVQQATAACGSTFLIPSDPQWPLGVADLAWSEPVNGLGGEPWGLWVSGEGDFARACSRSVAVVGARASTAYGEHVAAELGAELAERGYTVISGGAYGIDAAAHRGALSCGATVAVMAGGLAKLYPPGNAALLTRIRDAGFVVSESPPDCVPSRARFLVRNRLIAALAQATVIVEGAVRSGAQNTVSWALSMSRPVLAVPGPVTSAMSVTPHRLIRNGEATLATCVEEIVSVLEPLDPRRETLPWAKSGAGGPLSDQERTLVDALPHGIGVSVDEVCARLGWNVVTVLGVLSRVEQAGWAQEYRPGVWRQPRQPPSQ
ncbi:MAG: DNA-protecting protein DprA [Propionibacteriaceae bacterium]|jgi:DNA processing protein|nr:DNA-protecting protein DprA [Propionibacteriaceae bacterium]